MSFKSILLSLSILLFSAQSFGFIVKIEVLEKDGQKIYLFSDIHLPKIFDLTQANTLINKIKQIKDESVLVLVENGSQTLFSIYETQNLLIKSVVKLFKEYVKRSYFLVTTICLSKKQKIPHLDFEPRLIYNIWNMLLEYDKSAENIDQRNKFKETVIQYLNRSIKISELYDFTSELKAELIEFKNHFEQEKNIQIPDNLKIKLFDLELLDTIIKNKNINHLFICTGGEHTENIAKILKDNFKFKTTLVYGNQKFIQNYEELNTKIEVLNTLKKFRLIKGYNEFYLSGKSEQFELNKTEKELKQTKEILLNSSTLNIKKFFDELEKKSSQKPIMAKL